MSLTPSPGSLTAGTRLDRKTVRVRARYADDTPASGTGVFERTGGPLVDTTDHEFILPRRVPISFDAEGEAAAVLEVTDDDDLNPTGFTWTFTPNVAGVSWPPKTFTLSTALPDEVWLDSLGSVPSSTPVIAYAEFNDARFPPAGGDETQVLAKASDDDHDYEWVDQSGGGTGLPVGGTLGQTLIKQSGTNGDADWEDVPHELPTGGTTGQVVAKASNADHDYTYVTQPSTAGGISYAGGPDLAAGTVEVAMDVLAGRVTPVDNGANATPTRPSGVTVVLWYGSVRPTASMTAADIYIADIGTGGGSVTFGTPTGSVGIAATADAGSGTTSARATHVHPVPAPPTGYPVDVAGTRVDGTATTPARSDHRHTIAAGIITGAMVSLSAAIPRAALSLWPVDSPANVGSERTLGVTPTSAAPGDLALSTVGAIPVRTGIGRGQVAPGAVGSMLMSVATNQPPIYVPGVRVVKHGSVGSTARPTADVVLWIGSVFPSNMNGPAGDMWNDQS